MKKAALVSVGLSAAVVVALGAWLALRPPGNKTRVVEYGSIDEIAAQLKGPSTTPRGLRYSYEREILNIRAWGDMAVAKASDGLFYWFDEEAGLLRRLRVPGLSDVLDVAEINGRPCALGIGAGRKGYSLVCDAGFHSRLAGVARRLWPKAGERFWTDINLPSAAQADSSNARLLIDKDAFAVMNRQHVYLYSGDTWETFAIPAVQFKVGWSRESIEI
ncbi:MAG: hypothetical protein WC889_17755, partial [Myxococcota bacterium]